jgi:hypothetical protein
MRLLIGLERALVGILWLVWVAYWIAAARQTAANRRTESLLTGASYRIPLLIGIILMVLSNLSVPGIGFSLWPLNPFILGIAVILTIPDHSRAEFRRLGATPSRKILERTNHPQSGPPRHPDRPICLGSPSDLQRAHPRVTGHCYLARHCSGLSWIRVHGRLISQKVDAGRKLVAIAFRTGVRTLSKASEGADSASIGDDPVSSCAIAFCFSSFLPD